MPHSSRRRWTEAEGRDLAPGQSHGTLTTGPGRYRVMGLRDRSDRQMAREGLW